MSVLVLSESANEGEQLLDDLEDDAAVEPLADTRLPDERANVPVSVVTERFLRTILDRVPLDRIEELHLFSPLRQGTVETGIAVVAARVIVLEEVPAPLPLELKLDGPESEPTEMAAPTVEEPLAVVEALEDERAPDVDSPYADEPVQLKLMPTSEYPDDENNESVAPIVPDSALAEAESEEPPVRYTVYTARYRLIVKGPDRGKWEMDVVDEADAPLRAVETVVRGVQRRAGEETATVRYDAAQLARVLRIPVPE